MAHSCLYKYVHICRSLHICRSCFRSLYTVLSFDWYMSLDNIFLGNKTDTHRHYNNVSWWRFYWDKLRWQLPSVELLLSKSTTKHYSKIFQILSKKLWSHWNMIILDFVKGWYYFMISLTLYSFILGKSIFRSPKFWNIKAWTQQ